jgi:hypothetical protein
LTTSLCVLLISRKAYYSVSKATDLEAQIKSSCEFVTFPDSDAPSYFLKHKNRGAWNCNLQEPYLSAVRELQAGVPDFDIGLKWILFGYGGTHIYQSEAGFLASVQGVHNNENHPLNKVCPRHKRDTISQTHTPRDFGRVQREARNLVH